VKAKSYKRNHIKWDLFVCVYIEDIAVTCFSTNGPSTGSSLKMVHLYWNIS